MKTQCIAAVETALGRRLGATEAADIEARINAAMKNLARQDPAAWRRLTQDVRWQRGAEEAGRQLVGEAKLARDRVAATIAIKARIDARAQENAPGDHLGHLDAMMAFTPSGKGRQISIESAHRAILRDAIGGIQDAFKVAEGDIFGFTMSKEGALALVREAHGQPTDVPLPARRRRPGTRCASSCGSGATAPG